MAVTIGSTEELHALLSGRPSRWAKSVAARLALRTLPLVLKSSDVWPAEFYSERRQGLILHAFRATFIAWAAQKHPAEQMSIAALAAATEAGRVAQASYGADSAAAHAAHAAACAANAIADYAAYAAHAARASAYAAHAADYAASAAAVGDVWAAITADCRWLEAMDGASGRLIDQPLWPIDFRGNTQFKANLPPWARLVFDGFADSEIARETSWNLFVDWYRAILPNRPPFDRSRSLFDETASIAIATQEDEFWKVKKDRSAEDIMEDVAQIARWEGQKIKDVDPTMREFILRMLNESDQPLKIPEIVRRFGSAGYSSRDYSIRGRLNELASEQKIQRVGRGSYAALGWKADGKARSYSTAIPVPPSQGHGPHLGVKDGQIVFAPVSNIAQPGTNLARVEVFLPLVRGALNAFLKATPPVPERGNDPFQREKRMASHYLDASSGDTQNMDFDLLFGVGTSLMNRLVAETRRSLESDLAPFSDAQRLALEDFQANHGPMIVATAAGAEAVANAEKMIRNPDEERKLREAVVAFMEAVKAEQGLAKPEVADLLHDAATEMGTGHQAERSFQFGHGAARNTTIVLASVGRMTALPAVGLGLGGPIGAVLGTIFSYVLWEATKKSKPFEKAIKPVTELLNGLSELDREKLDQLIESGTSDRFARFTLKEEARLRAIAGDRPEFEWLHQQLDFLKKITSPGNSRSKSRGIVRGFLLW